MTMFRVAPIAMLGALVVACSMPAVEKKDPAATAATELAAARTAIDAANAGAIAALNAGDVAKWSTHYADDAMVMMSNTPAWKGRTDLEAGLKGMMSAAAISNFKLVTGDVMLGGDLAIETGSYEMTLTPKGGKAMVDKGKYVTTWKKQADGGWKIVRDISNSDLPAGK